MRQSLVIANWKLNGDLNLIETMVSGLMASATERTSDVVICPPAIYISALRDAISTAASTAASISIGAQNCSENSSGAFTGEIAPAMLAEVGCEYVIVGHSERRSIFHESDAIIANKVNAVQQAGLTPVLCVGESLEQRENNETIDVVTAQIKAATVDVDSTKLVIAYEPVWAIGTGKTATPEQAQEVHHAIRTYLRSCMPNGDTIALLYGGSVKADNAAQLFAQDDIDGGLIGGASLNTDEFRAICSAVKG